MKKILNGFKKVMRNIYRIVYNVSTMDDYFREKNKIDIIEKSNLNDDVYKDLETHEKNMRYIRRVGGLVRPDSWKEEKNKERVTLENEILIDNCKEELWERFNKEISYIRKQNKLLVFPYEYTEKYYEQKNDIKVFNAGTLKYVVHNGKKLFFPACNEENIINNYLQLKLEQDKESPHLYFSENVGFNNGIFVDVGSAEGIISLDVLDAAKEIYLLERSKEWVEALNATFAEYRSKVHIIQKYAGCSCAKDSITLDSLLEKYTNENIFIKMDVEGMEMDVLYGCIETIKRNNCKFACTCYHTNTMENKLRKFFTNKGFKTETSKGYMLFMYGEMTLKNGMYEKMEYPYFRRGLIRAYKEA